VGFEFYAPDPALKKWRKNDKKLRKKGVSKKHRPPMPSRCASCPTVLQIGLRLLKQFKIDHPGIKIDCILADALYGTRVFLDEASAIFNPKISAFRAIQEILLMTSYE
jgi:hypothetical protein